MSTQQSRSNTHNIHITQEHALEDPSMEWTSEPLDMTSIREDFWAFFGQGEEEWDRQVSTFSTDDMQMADDAGAAGQATTTTTTCMDPAPFMNVGSASTAPAGSLSANDTNPNVMPPREYTMSGPVPCNNGALQQAPTTTGINRSRRRNPATGACDAKTTTAGAPRRAGHDERFQELMHSLQEVRAELGVERQQCATYQRALHSILSKRMEDLTQHEVMNALKHLEQDCKEVRPRLHAERTRSAKYQMKFLEANRERMWALARLEKVEEMNLQWQEKYAALNLRWHQTCEKSAAEAGSGASS